MEPDELPRTTVSRERAAEMLGVSVRTVDRHIPAGTPGRYAYKDHPGQSTQIEIELVKALMPAPGGDPLVSDPE